jgi:hypothetical protein
MSMHPAGEAYTLQDYLQWEGDWELIRGQPVCNGPVAPASNISRSAPPSFGNSTNRSTIARIARRCFEIDVEFAQDTVVRPDVLVICYQPEGERLTPRTRSDFRSHLAQDHPAG